MLWPRAHPVVEAGGDVVQAFAVTRVDPWAEILLALAQDHLAWQQQLPTADHLLPGVHAFGVVDVVAAPSGVHRPDCATRMAETPGAQAELVGGVRPGASTAVLAAMLPHHQRKALRLAFLGPSSGEVQQLARLPRHRQGHQQFVHLVGLRPQIADPGPGAQQPLRGQLDEKLQFEFSTFVPARHPNAARSARVHPAGDRLTVHLQLDHLEAGRPVTPPA